MDIQGLRKSLQVILDTDSLIFIETNGRGMRTTQRVKKAQMIFNDDELQLITDNTDYRIRFEHFDHWETIDNVVRIYNNDSSIPYIEHFEIGNIKKKTS